MTDDREASTAPSVHIGRATYRYRYEHHLRWLIDEPAFRDLHRKLHWDALEPRRGEAPYRELSIEEACAFAGRAARYAGMVRQRLAPCLPRTSREALAWLLVTTDLPNLPEALDRLKIPPHQGFQVRERARVDDLQRLCRARLANSAPVPRRDGLRRESALARLDVDVEMDAYLGVGTVGILAGQPLAASATMMAQASCVVRPPQPGWPTTVWASDRRDRVSLVPPRSS